VVKRQRIQVTGRVQGVGFRPFAYRLAAQFGLSGFVFNDTRGVTIEIQGLDQRLVQFCSALNSTAGSPPLMKIRSCIAVEIPVIVGESKFKIRQSDSSGTALSQVTVDSATCPDCLRELFSPGDYRFHYPFINCTNCGPRYTIIKTIPYDRPNTTMSDFPMCDVCRGQYESVADRRFHAQPVACEECGPKIQLTDNSGNSIETESDIAIHSTINLLLDGKIIAIKGIGGFHLAVNALDYKAVLRLRERKQREHKPFALMAGNIGTISRFVEVDETAAQLLNSPQAPIVLLPVWHSRPRLCSDSIAPSVATGMNTLGFMLPYAPLHHLLFNTESDGRKIEVLVMTSGNISDEPLIRENAEAIDKLSGVSDYFLMHNRDIYRQVDDSVVHIIDKNPAILRRSRGYVPTPILLDQPSPIDILAAGSDLKNTFCLVKQNQLILSEHIGDLEEPSVYRHYVKSIKHLAGLFEVNPKLVVCDLHPAYFSTQHAQSLAGMEVLQVQHHWAHAAAVIAEYGCAEPVIALCADGTGYGSDGAVWGCECLIADLEKFERIGHLSYYPLAGADRASKEPIRPILGLLKQTYGHEFSPANFADVLKPIEPDLHKIEAISSQLEKGTNVVQTSSLGRVFDAVAALLGLGTYNYFEAQLPMALEACADPQCMSEYTFQIGWHGQAQPVQGERDNSQKFELDLTPTIRQIIAEIRTGTAAAVVSAKFHNTLARALSEMAREAHARTGIDTVALSGGVFCNRFLTERLITLLKESNFCVLLNRHAPANDGSIALGQAAIGARHAILKGL
jgi:hydrogenase maturation protein HypF